MSTRFVNIHIITCIFSFVDVVVLSQIDVCVSSNDIIELDGVYQYLSYNETINSAIYHCADCGWNNAPSFLHGFRHKWADAYENYWIIGPDPRSQSAWSYCKIGVRESDYKFNITDCNEWLSYVNNILVSDDITTTDCNHSAQETVSYTPSDYPSIVFGFKTPSSVQAYGTTIATITMTLFWNYTKYQCDVLPFKSDTMYLCDTSAIDTTLCDDALNTISYGLQIDNNDNDAIEIDEIIIKHIHNQSVETDIMFDYFCTNILQQNPYWPKMPGRCLDALYGGYNIFAMDTDDTNAPFNLFVFDESLLFNDNEPRIGLESYVVPQTTASSCAASAENNRYELIARLKNSRVGTFSSNIKMDGNENEDDMNANTYSIIGKIADIIQDTPQLYKDTDGKYQFTLIYNNADGTQDVIDFKQRSWIQDTAIEEYEAIDVSVQDDVGSECDLFKGLALSSSDETYIDGSDSSSSCWWNSVGTIALHTDTNGYTGIPAFNSKIAYSFALYILKPLSNNIGTTLAPFTTTVNHVAHDIIIAYQEEYHDTTLAFNEKQQHDAQHTPTAPQSTILTHIQMADDWDIFNIDEASTLHIIVGICIVFVCCSIPLFMGICIGCCCYHRSKKKSDEPQSSAPKDKNNENSGEMEIKIDPMQPEKELNVGHRSDVMQKQHMEGYKADVHKMSLFSQESELSDGMYENVKQNATPQNIAIVRPQNTNHINPRTEYMSK